MTSSPHTSGYLQTNVNHRRSRWLRPWNAQKGDPAFSAPTVPLHGTAAACRQTGKCFAGRPQETTQKEQFVLSGINRSFHARSDAWRSDTVLWAEQAEVQNSQDEDPLCLKIVLKFCVGNQMSSSSRVRFISTFFEGAPLHPVAYWGQVVAGLRQRFRTAGWMSSFPDPELSCSLSPLACRVSAVWLALPFPAPTSSYS